jgi:hypothetical protein
MTKIIDLRCQFFFFPWSVGIMTNIAEQEISVFFHQQFFSILRSPLVKANKN